MFNVGSRIKETLPRRQAAHPPQWRQEPDTTDLFRDTRLWFVDAAMSLDRRDTREIEAKSIVFAHPDASRAKVLREYLPVAWPLLKETCGS